MPDGLRQQASATQKGSPMAQSIREVMTADPRTVEAGATCVDAAREMRDGDVGSIVVVENGAVAGIVTDRDIVVRVVAKGKNPSEMTAAQCMSEPVVVVNEDTTLEDVLAVMEENQIRRVPVVDASGCCCGIISQADVAECATEDQTGEMVREVSKDAPGLTH